MDVVICKHDQRFVIHTTSVSWLGGIPAIGTNLTIDGQKYRVTEVNRDLDAGKIYVHTGKDY